MSPAVRRLPSCFTAALYVLASDALRQPPPPPFKKKTKKTKRQNGTPTSTPPPPPGKKRTKIWRPYTHNPTQKDGGARCFSVGFQLEIKAKEGAPAGQRHIEPYGCQGPNFFAKGRATFGPKRAKCWAPLAHGHVALS